MFPAHIRLKHAAWQVIWQRPTRPHGVILKTKWEVVQCHSSLCLS